MNIDVRKEENGTRNVIGLRFCCNQMSKAVLFGDIKTQSWTDHDINFYMRTLDSETNFGPAMNYCIYCGAKIRNIYHTDENVEVTILNTKTIRKVLNNIPCGSCPIRPCGATVDEHCSDRILAVLQDGGLDDDVENED